MTTHHIPEGLREAVTALQEAHKDKIHAVSRRAASLGGRAMLGILVGADEAAVAYQSAAKREDDANAKIAELLTLAPFLPAPTGEERTFSGLMDELNCTAEERRALALYLSTLRTGGLLQIAAGGRSSPELNAAVAELKDRETPPIKGGCKG